MSILLLSSLGKKNYQLLEGYKKEDIMNLDEIGCFWRALPNHGFGQKGMTCKGGKKCKHRITIYFLVSAAGGKEKPIVIGKSENPRCFKRFEKSLLPVKYYSQNKSWMTGDILDDILTKLNHLFCSTNRRVALLMDNAGCHPENLRKNTAILL